MIKPEETHEYIFGSFRVNYDTYEVFENNKKAFDLSNREIRLFKLLADKQGEVVSREEILDTIWGQDAFPSSRTIDNYILAFRKYFKDNPRNPSHFHSIRGVGYKFTP
jgi:two-component system alkaline phosphatase synthesis response regulator PhoP